MPESGLAARLRKVEPRWLQDGYGGGSTVCEIRLTPDERDALLAALEDAERYRWLRANEQGGFVEKHLYELAECEESLDAAIDAARNAGSCCGHASDCAVHNEPAMPAGKCDCGFDAARQQGSR